MVDEKLQEIIQSHVAWILGESSGKRANLRGANLRGANFAYANLRNADLRGADLYGANLHGTDMRSALLLDTNLLNANLHGADLRDADLWGANLRGANLRGANLDGADIRGATGNRKEIKSIFVAEQYPITYTSEYMQIGCEIHKIQDWWSFDDAQIVEMDGKKALKFWREWKDTIRSIIEKSPAVKC